MYEFVVYIICKGLYSSCIQYLIHSTHFSHAILVGCERQNYSKRKRCKTRRVRRRIRTNIRMRWRWSRTLLNSQLFSCPVQLIDSKLHCVIEQHDQTISSYCFYLTTSPFSFFFCLFVFFHALQLNVYIFSVRFLRRTSFHCNSSKNWSNYTQITSPLMNRTVRPHTHIKRIRLHKQKRRAKETCRSKL